jgi:hypothetical protein
MADAIGGIDFALDRLGKFIKKEAGNERRSGSKQERKSDEQSDSRRNREDRGEPGIWHGDEVYDEPVETEPDQRQQEKREAKRLEQHGAKWRREDLSERGKSVIEHLRRSRD